MRIIAISGIWSDSNPVWPNIKSAFQDEFPHSMFILEEEVNCQPWQLDRMRTFTKRLVAKYDDGVESLYVGHSMGGIVSCAVVSRLQKNNVRGIVTIFSPHQYLGGIFSRALGAQEKCDVPIVSFQAIPDTLVPWGARHPSARSHTVIHSTHKTAIARRPEIARQIVSIVKRELFPNEPERE